ncbi:hypothetical protein ACFE04_000013 [Oxalis oulophora]
MTRDGAHLPAPLGEPPCGNEMWYHTLFFPGQLDAPLPSVRSDDRNKVTEVFVPHPKTVPEKAPKTISQQQKEPISILKYLDQNRATKRTQNFPTPVDKLKKLILPCCGLPGAHISHTKAAKISFVHQHSGVNIKHGEKKVLERKNVNGEIIETNKIFINIQTVDCARAKNVSEQGKYKTDKREVDFPVAPHIRVPREGCKVLGRSGQTFDLVG